jgi:hypothetical protein
MRTVVDRNYFFSLKGFAQRTRFLMDEAEDLAGESPEAIAKTAAKMAAERKGR